MDAELLVGGLLLLYGVLLAWSCRTLPDERWQILASLPRHKGEHGAWSGTNITTYGLLQANAFVVGSALMLLAMASIGVAVSETLLVMVPLMALAVPACRWVAAWVERKPATFTVGGAMFVGLLVAPWLVLGAGALMGPGFAARAAVVPVLAAMTIGYAAGEGLGRLACISFGCCYGKPLRECPHTAQRLFRSWHFVFTGPNKKVSYEGGLEGQRLFPVQGLSSAICVGSALVGLYLFLRGEFAISLWVTLSVTQLWRAYSETLRADYRGGGRLSAYQWMALFAVLYGGAMPFLFPVAAGAVPSTSAGLSALWTPGVVVGLQLLWLGILIYLGRSRVTTARIELGVQRDAI